MTFAHLFGPSDHNRNFASGEAWDVRYHRKIKAEDLDPISVVGAIIHSAGDVNGYANRWTVAWNLGVPDKVLLAKARRMIAAGIIDGCACGCRGDFHVNIDTARAKLIT